MKKTLFFLFSVIVAIGVIFAIGATNDVKAQSASVGLGGWSWSSNIGWISLGSTTPTATYQVRKDNATNLLSGYAWSPTIGWITFDRASLASCPNAPCEARFAGNNMIGWARACAVFASGCAGATKNINGDELGGWDGWISLNQQSTAPVYAGQNGYGGDTYGSAIAYGGKLDAQNHLSGYGWGAVVGWIAYDAFQDTDICRHPYALNQGQPLPCQFPPNPPQCLDPVATNFLGPIPCRYDVIICPETGLPGVCPTALSLALQAKNANGVYNPATNIFSDTDSITLEATVAANGPNAGEYTCSVGNDYGESAAFETSVQNTGTTLVARNQLPGSLAGRDYKYTLRCERTGGTRDESFSTETYFTVKTPPPPPTPDFTISASPSTVSMKFINPTATSSRSIITITRIAGFNATVHLDVDKDASTIPLATTSALKYKFYNRGESPSSAAPSLDGVNVGNSSTSSSFDFYLNSTTAFNTHNGIIYIRASGGGINKTLQVKLNASPTEPDFEEF
jgi:hypothetical protein